MHKAQLKLLRSPASAAPLVVRSPKTMVPRQGERIFARKRLFIEIEDRLARGHLWIGGPPGAGKTVLAANYAARLTIPVAWYEFDLLDTDPISFFSSFPQTFYPLSPDSSFLSSLPQPFPEDMLALPIFARKFFRALFSGLGGKWQLVLDNVQEIPKDSPLAEVLALCLREIPINCRVILLSRQAPPPAFAKIKTEGLLQTLDSDLLRFTRKEIAEVTALHGINQEQENCIDYLHRTTAGWAAGLTLLLEEQNREGCGRNPGGELDYQELFDYFTGVIFAGLSAEEKERLMLASRFPEIRPGLLDRLQGNHGAGEYFLRLSRENFFTYRLDRRGELFQFHPLFKEFLRQKGQTIMDAAVLTGFLEQAADFFVTDKRIPAAVDLLIQAKSWNKAVERITTSGPAMLDQGRFRTLLRWQQALPRRIVDENPWPLFFFGVATTAFDPLEAIEILKKSFSLFQKQGNGTGALLACCSLTNSIINHLSDLSALDPWLDFLEEQLDPRIFPNDGSFENDTIASAVARAFVLRRPAHPDLELWLGHVVNRGGMHPALITHYLWTGRFPEARAALDNIYSHIDQIGSKLLLSAIRAMEVQYYLIICDADKCIRVIEESRKMMKETGIRVWEVHFFILGAGCLLNCGRRKEAAGYLQLMEKNIDKARLLERSYYHVVKTLEALLDDDLPAADQHQCSALDMAKKIGMPSYNMWCWYGSALVAVFQDNYPDAVSRFAQVFELAASPGNPWFTCQAHLGMAYMYLRKEARDKALYHLQEGFSLARQKNYLTFFFFLPEMMGILAVTALEENIEAKFVCRFVEHWRLTPRNPPVHLSNWPWPIRIFTLGRFSILRHGKKLDAAVLAKNKPIQLLQAIIALGGRQVSKTRLADIFWPQSNGDEQAAALKTTLHRLRELLHVRDTIIQTSSYLTLNPRVCWVDSWQFERLAGKALSENPELQSRLKVKQQAVAGYRGDFLPTLQDEPWTFDYRQRLQYLFEQLEDSPAGLAVDADPGHT
jgi:ATP/maltotriose-dependent transcriptional regulator MalT